MGVRSFHSSSISDGRVSLSLAPLLGQQSPPSTCIGGKGQHLAISTGAEILNMHARLFHGLIDIHV